ncbi:MAG: hypothetical protein OXG88_05360 [Gammaproteobacteria bacterium]|nr:hypothetical protein [Gammaproteobacteria bacterium]
MTAKLIREFDYYLKHQDEFVKKYYGKYIVLKNDEVIGTFDTATLAVLETSKTHELGTFLVQLVSTGDEAYTATFHSRARFA